MATVTADADTRPIAPVDVSDAALYTEDRWQEPFAQLRAEMPLAWHPESPYGPYWSVSSHGLIQQVEALPDIYSSDTANGGITIIDPMDEIAQKFENFIAMDRPRHTEQRRVVQPSFNPSEMARREVEIRQRVGELFDVLPVGETFNWVERVSIPITIGMICALFDFPWEERHDLKRWSDWASEVTPDQSEERRMLWLEQMMQMLTRFDRLFEEKRAAPPADDLMSRIIHSEAMGQMPPAERMGNVALLIVGGNDTTRNSMSGFIDAINRYPDQLDKLRADPSLIPNAASEIIRWQSPVTHMRRTALEDTELDGHAIKAGEKLILWYISGNRDEALFADADRFDVTRENARRHIGFGFGIHRCVGARLAELQLQIYIEQIVKRGWRVEPRGDWTRLESCFLHGFTDMPVEIVAEG
ncbi:cytochrome P450 [uncultured Parasphingopyxis sp.]|mgnify:CR=1 FL=1|uniref:cytochrome P450 n=1 Tax=uncultured Parasphingopyxis sp. TaxID=1547918 RepID=UPI0026380C58|nr:cytochrome P450 [uncultured Parasphingopyxis sp.]